MNAIEAAAYAQVKIGFLLQAATRGQVGTKDFGTGQYVFTTTELDAWLLTFPPGKGRV